MTDLRKSSAQPRPTLAVASLLALSSRVGTQAIYDAIIDYADGLYAVDSVAIILVDGGNFRAVASRGWNKDELREVTTGPRDQDLLLLEVTAERGVPMIVEDTLKSPFWATHAALRHIRAHAAIPLALDDGVIGILCLESRVAGMVAEVHSPVLEALGLHAAVAIHNARLYEKSARRAAELALLERISARIGQNLELTELLATILDDVLQHFEGVTTGRIFLYEEGRLTWGMVFDIHSRISHLIEEPEPDSLYYRVARHVERFVIDASGLMHPIQTEEMDFAAAAVALPLAIGQRTVGVLSVHFDEIYQTNGDMLRLLRLIADQTAVAIENHLYFRRAERRGSELEFLINVLTAAAVARPISDSLVDVAKLIRVSLGAAAIAIYLPESSRGADGEEQILLHATAIDGGERTPDQVEPILVGDPNNLAGLVAKDLSPEVIDGLENQSAYLPINSQAYAVMFVPLAKGEVLAGLITIEFLVGGNPYDQDMMKLLLVLANTLPSVIQNMTLWNQLSESEKRFRQLAESVHEVFCLIDPVHHRLLYMSPAFETVWGRPMNYLLDETLDPFLETIYPDDRPGFLKQRALSVAGVTADAIELRIVRPAGDLRWIRMNIFPIENEVGQIYRLATICEDITQRKVAEEQALELVVERHKTHLLGEFHHQYVARLSHAAGDDQHQHLSA